VTESFRFQTFIVAIGIQIMAIIYSPGQGKGATHVKQGTLRENCEDRHNPQIDDQHLANCRHRQQRVREPGSDFTELLTGAGFS